MQLSLIGLTGGPACGILQELMHWLTNPYCTRFPVRYYMLCAVKDDDFSMFCKFCCWLCRGLDVESWPG